MTRKDRVALILSVALPLFSPAWQRPVSAQTPRVVAPDNNAHNRTEAFQNFIQFSGGACTVADLQIAVGKVVIGGTMDARDCTQAFTWNSILTITIPITIWLPCANVTFTTQLLSVTSDDVHVHGCGAGTTGGIDQGAASTAGSTYTASGLSGSIDAIVVKKTGSRSTITASRLSEFTLDNLVINMNGTGRRAIYTSACFSCVLDHIVVFGQNCSDGGIYQEADPPLETLFAGSYWMKMDNVYSFIQSGNTTCHPFYFDASNGEIAYGVYSNLFAGGWEQAAGSGSDNYYVNTSASSIYGSFDQNYFVNAKSQDPSPNAYGFKLQCRGNFSTHTAGRCFSLHFDVPQFERMFSTPGTGVGIGCVNDSGTADGTGCGPIFVNNLSNGGWAINEDSLNLGSGYMSCGNLGANLAGPMCRMTGGMNGPFAQWLRMDPTVAASGNGQTLYNAIFVPSFNDAGFTAATAYGLEIAPVLAVGGVGGNFTKWAALHLDGSGIAGGLGLFVTNSGIQVAGSSPVRAGNVIADQGSACTNGELTLSAGWGSTSDVTGVVGTGQTCEWIITARGIGIAASPTITDMLTNALPSASTVCEMRMVGGTGAAKLIDQTTLSATAPVFTFGMTPVAGSTYKVVRRCGP